MLEFQRAQMDLNECAVAFHLLQTELEDARDNYWPPADREEVAKKLETAKSGLRAAARRFTIACDRITKGNRNDHR
jgi:hypothetical protein